MLLEVDVVAEAVDRLCLDLAHLWLEFELSRWVWFVGT